MAIQVTCPGCLKRFTVSDKFAGKSGPCPNCQKQLKIPEKTEEVVIHAPKDDAPTDSKGRSILKPIRRREVSLSLPVILAVSLTAVVVVGLALGLGLSGDVPPPALLLLGAPLLAGPLVYIGYWFLHDDELAGFSGKELIVRCAICAAVFAGLWGVYAFVPAYVLPTAGPISGTAMVVFIPIMIALGTVASVLALELEVVQGALHYMFYFSITFFLAWLSGTPLGEPLPGNFSSSESPLVPAVAPADPGRPTLPVPSDPSSKPVPNLLQ